MNGQENKSNALGIGALVLGVIGLISCCCVYLSFILGIVAIVLGIISLVKHEKSKGFAISGLIMGGLAVIISIIMFAVSLLLYQSPEYNQWMDSVMEKFEDELQNNNNGNYSFSDESDDYLDDEELEDYLEDKFNFGERHDYDHDLD